MTDRAFVNDVCARFPGAEQSDPWGGGHDAWKIGGKMFACIGSMGDGVSVKCRDTDTAGMLIEAGVARRAPYFHKSWVNLGWDAPEDEVRHRLEMSYDTIRSGLTKRIQAGFAPREGS